MNEDKKKKENEKSEFEWMYDDKIVESCKKKSADILVDLKDDRDKQKFKSNKEAIDKIASDMKSKLTDEEIFYMAFVQISDMAIKYLNEIDKNRQRKLDSGIMYM
jgi:hypothetical protein